MPKKPEVQPRAGTKLIRDLHEGRCLGYRKENGALTKYGDCVELRALASAAYALGILMHVDGIPFGGE